MRRYETERLILRPWRADDRDAFAAMSADPQVMEFFTSTLDRTESDALVDRVDAHFAEHGFGVWAIEVKGGAPFVGFAGLVHVRFAAHFTPAIEIAWRLARPAWGQGYATEAAHEACRVGFEELRIDRIVAFTVPTNVRSRRVMDRLGMQLDADGEFDHPHLPVGHPFQRHLLYRLAADAWAPTRGRQRTEPAAIPPW